MEKIKYCVLGAGPAGLAFSNRLKQAGEYNFLVLEQNNEAGGLCRSVDVDGAPLDIGGRHFLDVRRPEVCKFLFTYMKREEWILYSRDSRIALKEELISHPLEANIWQMSQDEQVEYLKSIAIAGCNLEQDKPEMFIDWIYWKLGKKIADEYMLPYNRKMFGENLNQLGTYWLDKLPNVSFDQTLLSCLNKKAYGTQPGHAEFYYPENYGYGELWLRMAESIKNNIIYNSSVKMLNIKDRSIKTEDGKEYRADYIITTVPWKSLQVIGFDIPEEEKLVQSCIAELKHTGVEIAYFHDTQESEAQWIYVPDPQKSYHRILSRKTFCPNAHGYWTETNITRIQDVKKEYSYCNEYAYPLNTLGKPRAMEQLLSFMNNRQIIGLGRWGEHNHYNSDVVVERALRLADAMLQDTSSK